MKRHLSLTWTLAIMVLVMAANGFANDLSWKKIEKKGVLTVGFCAQYPPFEFKTETGEFKGFDVDMANALGKQLNIAIKLKDGEWQGLIAGLKKGDYDVLITGMVKTPERMERVDFSDKYVDLNEVLIVHKDEESIHGKQDLKEKTVGAQLASNGERVMNGIKDMIGETKTYNYTTEAFMDLKFKRIDALICSIAYAAVQIKKDPSFKVVGDPLKSNEICIALPKGSHELASRINSALTDIKANGTHQQIYEKWLGLN
ncbi:extracellular solute-binding protein, family 3 [Desulfosarcina variabilis str. Montpellier]|uniref:substrate-binding periplasmic protein n=1 Tax=Desulfosarcina variabilis TaxID=2300 RepID=UPI003AFB4889